MLCTKGFISVLDIGREHRYDLYDLRIEFPDPLVPLPLRREVDERINSNGKIENDLPEQEVIEAVQELKNGYDINSLAICFINSYRNHVHELTSAGNRGYGNFPIFPSPRLPMCFLQ